MRDIEVQTQRLVCYNGVEESHKKCNVNRYHGYSGTYTVSPTIEVPYNSEYLLCTISSKLCYQSQSLEQCSTHIGVPGRAIAIHISSIFMPLDFILIK